MCCYWVTDQEEMKFEPMTHLARMFFSIAGSDEVTMPACLYDREFGRLRELLDEFPFEERKMIEFYYGEGNESMQDFQDVAREFLLPREQVMEIISRILSKLMRTENRTYLLCGYRPGAKLNSTQFALVMEMKKLLVAELEEGMTDPDAVPLFIEKIYERSGIWFTLEADEGSRVSDDTELDQFDLSVRSYNCLRRANVKTIGELREFDEERLLTIRHVGRKSAKEMMQLLEKHPKQPGIRIRIKTKEHTFTHFVEGSEDPRTLANRLYWMLVDARPETKTIFQLNLHSEVVYYFLRNGYFFWDDIYADRMKIFADISGSGMEDYFKEVESLCIRTEIEKKTKETGYVTLKSEESE